MLVKFIAISIQCLVSLLFTKKLNKILITKRVSLAEPRKQIQLNFN